MNLVRRLVPLIFVCAAAVAVATPPSDQNFESVSATEGSNNNASLSVSGLVFVTNGGGTVETYDVTGYWGSGVSFTGHSGKAVIANYNGSLNTGITFFRFGSASTADKFRLNSLAAMANEIESSYSYAAKYKVEGFAGGSGGALVASVSEVNLLAGGTYGSGNAAIVYTKTNAFPSGSGNGGTLSFGSAWDNIDTVVFTVTDGKAAQLSLDSLDFSAPTPADTTPPAIVSIARQSPATQTISDGTTSYTFRVTYSEAVQNVTTAQFSVQAVSGSSIIGTVASVSGAGTTRDVNVNITGGHGEFRLKPID